MFSRCPEESKIRFELDQVREHDVCYSLQASYIPTALQVVIIRSQPWNNNVLFVRLKTVPEDSWSAADRGG